MFGLYESYLTKVIGNPTWAEETLKVTGVKVIETLLLALFWHCFLAFIFPLLIAEITLTNSKEILSGLGCCECRLIQRLQRGRLLFVLVFIAGFFQSINIQSLFDSAISGLSSTMIITAYILVWKSRIVICYSMRSLLPTDNEFRIIFVLFGFMYVWMGAFWRPEALPGFGPQFSVFVMYLFFTGFLIKGIEKSVSD